MARQLTIYLVILGISSSPASENVIFGQTGPRGGSATLQSFNCNMGHIHGIKSVGLHALRFYYENEEAKEGVRAWNDKRKVDYGRYRK